MPGRNATHEKRTGVGQAHCLCSASTSLKAAKLTITRFIEVLLETKQGELVQVWLSSNTNFLSSGRCEKNVHKYRYIQMGMRYSHLMAYHFEVKVLLQFSQHKWFPCFTLMLDGKWALFAVCISQAKL